MKANVGVYPACVQKALEGKNEYLDIIERGKFFFKKKKKKKKKN
jgi:hypothetical protein